MCPYASTALQGPDRTDTLVVCPGNTPRRWVTHVSVGVTMRWPGPGRGHASEALDLSSKRYASWQRRSMARFVQSQLAKGSAGRAGSH